MTAWLASQGLFGDEGKAAQAAQARSAETRRQAREAVAAAKAAHTRAMEHLEELAAANLESGRAELPTGVEVITARQAVEGAEMAAEAVEAACEQARQRWGKVLTRLNWSEVLARAEQVKGSDAEAATIWLRAKVHPPAGPNVDPFRWGL